MISRRVLLRFGVALGALLASAPLWGLAGTMYGMIRAFGRLGDHGISDPHALGRAIGETMLMTTSGLFVCPLGIALLIVCLSLLRRLRASMPPPLPQSPGNP